MHFVVVLSVQFEIHVFCYVSCDWSWNVCQNGDMEHSITIRDEHPGYPAVVVNILHLTNVQWEFVDGTST